MQLLAAFSLSSSGMEVQKKRLDIASENLANVSSTRTPEGGPYTPKKVVVEAVSSTDSGRLRMGLKNSDIQHAHIREIQKTSQPPKKVLDRGHPDADEQGFVSVPEISPTQELANMMMAARAYEANITTFNTAKTMMLKTIDLGGV